MGKYSDPGFTMAIAGTEAAYPLVAVAIDNHNKTSQIALKWAVEHLVKRGQTLVLVHVNTKGTSTGLVDASGYKQPDAQLRELFLPYRCFCTRKDVYCKDVVIDEGDVVRGLTEFIASASIEIMVLGSPSRGVLRRFKNSDLPISVSKGASDFCTVYIIGKEKVSNVRNAIRAAPTVSPLRPLMSNPSAPKAEATGGAVPPKWTAQKADHVSESALQHETSIKSPFARVNSNCSSRKSFCDFPAFSDSTDISFVSSGRPSMDRYGFQPRLSNGSESNLDHSFEMMRTPHRFSSSNEQSNFSQSSTASYSSQNMDDVESEIRRLRMELRQTMDMYSTACREALDAKQKLTDLERRKIEEQQKLYEARSHEEAAVQMMEEEKEKARAAVEAAEKSNRLAELEAKKRLSAELKALKEAEEKKKMMVESVHNDLRCRKYTINEIELATDNFNMNHKIGEGGYGPVFKGYLDHTLVAIKVLRPDATQGRSQFQQEVEVLSCIRHPNMVILMGACPEYGCLVYEYMASGSLDDRLFRRGGTPTIPWQHRFRIAAEIATGLLFLHQTKPEPLVHRDLKPANILLDGNYVSKISDVGLARLVPSTVADDVTQYRMTSTAGTFCYIDPEYQQTGMLGVKSDIYSLGVMLLQIITARPPMGLTHTVSRAIENGKFVEVLDPEVHNWPVEAAQHYAEMALRCAEMRRKDRPDLATDVLPELHRLRLLGEGSLQSSWR
ncbi:kinase with adenine nucleotide alpha hydrolases-like domain-containing protein [Rhynchospora pubera]|uniref:Kinase with adenine nucleotide alpha hydrolases-like domain-containing protein n=1 Tax=Rhynchospora pubera TaxID=906938 RepID=A0AAV8CJ96_9POAL|nr:kinase with adenine nucleotide alpha hydrolases-like domain-containing protein [Rhynchospora pubera]KAJ4816512.1 kinase with adenine nucleotide alpha hydrolases-like domain-containing protein [Rhynchospora pubera]